MPSPTSPHLFFPVLAAEQGGEGDPSSAAQVPDRTTISAEYQWRLTDIYATPESWQADFDKLKLDLKEISPCKGQLGLAATPLARCLKLRDELSIICGKLYSYARMHRDEDTADAFYQALTGKIESLLTEVSAVTAFIEPEILAIPDETLAAYRQQCPDLQEYSFYFDNLTRQKKHVLSPIEEEILARSSEAIGASEEIFNMLAHADMRFPDITDERGQLVTLSEGRYRSFIMSQQQKVRESAFKALFGSYEQYRNTFAATLSGNVKKNLFLAKTRNYSSVMESALETDNVPLAVYDNLLATVHNHLPLLHRYVALKKKALGLAEIHMYDLYTPIIRDVTLNFEYQEALELVQAALEPLGVDYGSILTTGLSSGWIDVFENKGKQTGAYSWGTYGVHPFVLLNYHGRYDDVSTIAHEMGHALHSYYSHAHQPYATSSYTTFCAEVASTTNEVLLMDHMLTITTDKDQEIYLINQQLESIRATVYRQTLFAEFEKLLFATAESGETLTADLLDKLWLELNTVYYGPDITIDAEVAVEWARIPHFYWSFYVYQYVTGFSAATALAKQLQTQGIPAQTRYLDFLKSGGSDYSLQLLKQAGVDMSTPQPIQVTLEKFDHLLTQLEHLLNQS